MDEKELLKKCEEFLDANPRIRYELDELRKEFFEYETPNEAGIKPEFREGFFTDFYMYHAYLERLSEANTGLSSDSIAIYESRIAGLESQLESAESQLESRNRIIAQYKAQSDGDIVPEEALRSVQACLEERRRKRIATLESELIDAQKTIEEQRAELGEDIAQNEALGRLQNLLCTD